MPDSPKLMSPASQSPISPLPKQSAPQTRNLPGTDLPIIPRRLLIVEDHASTASVLRRLLERHGHEVWIALTYQQALKMSCEHVVEAVICDLELPDGDGCDLLRELHKQRSIRGIVLSGHGTAEDLQRSKDAGFVAHLVKPFDIMQIEHTLNKVFL